MNAQARADFQQADADLNKTYQSVLAKLRDPREQTKAQGNTTSMGHVARCRFVARAAKEAEGGSMAPTLRYEAMTDVTRRAHKRAKGYARPRN